ncbi:hypothetical protein PsorP6_002191 [Peronosclerospora sorghi]|uniref:Uncharacterized protein n=1 Tax=Peronosclerospora sorghi TaxID=230839 RepID=A0ACC0WVY6_9STRA|nr:hypothetical protein PsorP6_002191 [Peronosclerospora sorghi]
MDCTRENNFETEEGKTPEMWTKVWKGPRHVYFGYSAALGLHMRGYQKYATGLDTGCCYDRKLTACVIPVRKNTDFEDEFYSAMLYHHYLTQHVVADSDFALTGTFCYFHIISRSVVKY